MQEKTIQTEVDRLVSLIKEEEKISVKNAARKLGVPVSTVSEWAAFLEEEGVINIEYKFTTPFLVKKKLSQEQAEQLKGNVRDEKDIFDRKSTSTLTYLNKLETEVDSLKDLFNDLGKHFKNRLSEADKEFRELKKAEVEKEKINKEIIESKQNFIKQLSDVNKQLAKEEANYKEIYGFLFNQSQIGSRILDIQEDEIELIRTTDKLLTSKLKSLRKKLDKKKLNEMKKKGKMTDEAESNLRKLELKYCKLKEALEKETKAIGELMRRNKEQEEQANELKKHILVKVKCSNTKLDKNIGEVKGIPQKLKSFMSKKDKILKILDGISYHEKMFKEKLNDLVKRGSALNLTGDAGEVMIEIKELEEGICDIAKKKSFFETEIKKIFGLLK